MNQSTNQPIIPSTHQRINHSNERWISTINPSTNQSIHHPIHQPFKQTFQHHKSIIILYEYYNIDSKLHAYTRTHRLQVSTTLHKYKHSRAKNACATLQGTTAGGNVYHLAEARDAEDDDVKGEGPEGHAVEQQRQPEPQPDDVQHRSRNTFEISPEMTQYVFHLVQHDPVLVAALRTPSDLKIYFYFHIFVFVLIIVQYSKVQ